MRYVLSARLRALGLLCAVGLVGLAVPGGAAAQQTTFSYTGAAESWVVPAGVHWIAVDARGGHGGDGTEPELDLPGRGGGGGAALSGRLPVTPGETLTIRVGGRGADGSGSTGGAGGFNGGGTGGDGSDPPGWDLAGGGGGGATSITRGSSPIFVAGGGGGGGADGSGGNSDEDAPGAGGRKGTTSGGGAGGDPDAGGGWGEPGNPGSFGTGGDGGDGAQSGGEGGGGGGGGYYGGGGGATGNNTGTGGGGGGASFVTGGALGVTPGSPTRNANLAAYLTITPVSDEPPNTEGIGDPCPEGQVGTTPVCVDNLIGGIGQFSNTCTDSDAKVVDGFSGSVYTELRVQEHPTDPSVAWVCYRVWNATGSVDLGGRVDIDQGDGAPGLPSLEPDSSGCSVTPVNTTVGDPGDPTYGPYVIGVNSSPARACFRVGSFHQRVTASLPGVGGVPVVHQDDDSVPDPQERQGPAGYPSTICQNTAGRTRLVNMESGSTWIAVYSAPGGPGETRLCVRAQGALSGGGMLTVKGAAGVTPVVEGPVADTSPSSCGSNVIANDADPARYSIRRSSGTSNPVSICLSVGSSGQFGPPGQRFTVGTSGEPTAPVVWTPDPGTPG